MNEDKQKFNTFYDVITGFDSLHNRNLICNKAQCNITQGPQ